MTDGKPESRSTIPDKCPKCGIRTPWQCVTSGYVRWYCGTHRSPGGEPIESRNCLERQNAALREQLAERDARIAELEEMLNDLSVCAAEGALSVIAHAPHLENTAQQITRVARKVKVAADKWLNEGLGIPEHRKEHGRE